MTTFKVLTTQEFKERFMSINSMPRNLNKLEKKKEFLKLSDLIEGEHRFRIVQEAIGGFVEWENNKPFRYEEEPAYSKDPDNPARVFWAIYAWDYSQEGLFVIEITQKSLLDALRSCGESSEWGDLTTYDIKIKKTKTNKTTKTGKPVFDYSLIPAPHKPMSQTIVEAKRRQPATLEALYTGGYPCRDHRL
jgi:hypothetical protein